MKKLKLLAGAVGLALTAAVPAANASVVSILNFGSSSTHNTFFGTAAANGLSTKLSAIDAPVIITAIDPDSGVSGPVSAFLDFAATSTGAASVSSGMLTQHYQGHFEINSLANGTGINYLSAVFSDDVLSGLIGGTALTLLASDPPAGTLSFTSSLIPINHMFNPLASSFSLSAITPKVKLSGSTLGTFNANFASSNSANAIPEPATLFLAGLGLLGIAASRRNKNA